MKAVIVVELDLPDDEPDALQEAGAAIGRPPHAVRMHCGLTAMDAIAQLKEETGR